MKKLEEWRSKGRKFIHSIRDVFGLSTDELPSIARRRASGAGNLNTWKETDGESEDDDISETNTASIDSLKDCDCVKCHEEAGRVMVTTKCIDRMSKEEREKYWGMFALSIMIK